MTLDVVLDVGLQYVHEPLLCYNTYTVVRYVVSPSNIFNFELP